MANHRVDITGQRFGRLVAVEPVSKARDGQYIWRCRCDCGRTKDVILGDLKFGSVQSCGCFASESRSRILKEWHKRNPHNHATHGKSNTRLFTIWTQMRARCRDNRRKDYNGRGITVCKEWDSSFEAFRDWAFNNGYSDDLSIDRIDNNGNYEPENCRWADRITQCNNRRSSRMVTYQGRTQTLAQWCRELDLSYNAISLRINQRGWSEEEALRGYRD